ncbi:MAG: V-type ATPase subunit, partial [Candidatus Diapherotrites archaeon]|nr:V-type ATPase subunit [Candidatus Diapherotrites archaeon]
MTDSVFSVSTVAVRAPVFGYANSRTKAMQGLLLKSADFESMLNAAGVQDIFSMLERTDYRTDLVEAALVSVGTVNQIDMALEKNLSRTLKKLVRIVPKSMQDNLHD